MRAKPPKAVIIILIVGFIFFLYIVSNFLKSRGKDWDYTGYLEARVANLSFEFPGKVTEVKVRGGEHLKRGSPMVLLDTTDLHLKLTELNVRIEALDANSKALEEQISYSSDLLERLKRLKGESIAPDKIRELESRIRQLESKYDALRAERKALEIKRNQVEELLRGVSLVHPVMVK